MKTFRFKSEKEYIVSIIILTIILGILIVLGGLFVLEINNSMIFYPVLALLLISTTAVIYKLYEYSILWILCSEYKQFMNDMNYIASHIKSNSTAFTDLILEYENWIENNIKYLKNL